MLARVGSVSNEDLRVIFFGLIESVTGEWRIGKRSGERRIVVVLI